ncbi:MAG: TIGR00341 family protein [Alphaproteobacteria bacterium]|nr:TIGR00341 family protein [Alphaproteobacteria bacterium]
MALRLIEIIAPEGHTDTVVAIGDREGVLSVTVAPPGPDGRQIVHMIVRGAGRQAVIDELQRTLSSAKNWRVSLLPVEASIPLVKDNAEKKAENTLRETREELYADVVANSGIRLDFILLSILSAAVASVGLASDSVAVLVGAMVIAPLLGPLIALAFGAATGDGRLIGRALLTSAVGLGLAILVSTAIGAVLVTFEGASFLSSSELTQRTHVGYGGAVVGLASGAAAALALTSGSTSALVGVMVAVALMPPACAAGLFLAAVAMGEAAFGASFHALALAALNAACIVVASLIVFRLRGLTPLTFYEREAAGRHMLLHLIAWAVLLLIIVLGIARGL